MPIQQDQGGQTVIKNRFGSPLVVQPCPASPARQGSGTFESTNAQELTPDSVKSPCQGKAVSVPSQPVNKPCFAKSLKQERAIYPLPDSPAVKMSQSSPADEGNTFEHLWSSLEPDSTYFDLPQSGHAGGSEASNRTEVTMDVFQMRNMNDSVMSQFNLLNNSMDQSTDSRATSSSPYSSEHASNVPTLSPYSQPSSTFDTMSPAPVIPSNTDYPGPHHFEVTFQQSSTAKSATWTGALRPTCPQSCERVSALPSNPKRHVGDLPGNAGMKEESSVWLTPGREPPPPHPSLYTQEPNYGLTAWVKNKLWVPWEWASFTRLLQWE
ncbi:hypothetical protein lerEdw1_019730 [Lerista edwardsae]|nr:hypothetical protein lerEdw1_019730 [Lerista edwardsae]